MAVRPSKLWTKAVHFERERGFTMQSLEHKRHVIDNVSFSRCAECRADCSRRFAGATPFQYRHVHEYLSYVKPRIEAIRAGNDTVDARIWHRGFVAALHNRISSHLAHDGRKHAPEYAKYHLATYGNDWHYLNA